VLIGIAIVGVAFYAADKATQAMGLGMAYIIVWNAMTLTHFYVDGLVWAFRQPHVRETVGPYLTPGDRIVVE
jgi:hypothetical protein